LIKVHEEAAEIFAILLYVLGGISLIGLWANWKEQSFSKIIAIVTIVFSLVVLFTPSKPEPPVVKPGILKSEPMVLIVITKI
jgi:FtsH-binding integral membrane protein